MYAAFDVQDGRTALQLPAVRLPEVAAQLRTSPLTLARCLTTRHAVSTDARASSGNGDENATILETFMQAEDSPGSEGAVQRASFWRGASTDVAALLRTLPQMEGEMLAMRYGLSGSEPMTVRSIASKYGLKPGSVHNRLGKGLKLLGAARAQIAECFPLQELLSA